LSQGSGGGGEGLEGISIVDWGVIGLIAVAAACEVMGDLLLKYWAETNDVRLMAGGLATYLVSLVFFAFALKRGQLAVIVAFWVAIALVLMAVLGWLLFGEKLSPRNAAGIALVLIALFLLRP
jgi:multidrug transporter EmrE-like cation transporter